MATRIKSLLVTGPLVVPLNSGSTVRLSPGQSSPDLEDVEVAHNPKVDRLARQGLIEVEAVTDKGRGAESEDSAATAKGDRPSPPSQKPRASSE